VAISGFSILKPMIITPGSMHMKMMFFFIIRSPLFLIRDSGII